MYQVYLGLGTNLGNRLENLSNAIQEINQISKIVSISSVYETEPVDMIDAEYFYNIVVCINTRYDPSLLLNQLKKIEKKLGRKSYSHLQPRIIDIDILLYRGIAYEDHTVCVPHTKLEHRRFALEPFYEISPTTIHPKSEKTIATLLRCCRDKHKVSKTTFNLTDLITNKEIICEPIA